MVHCWIDILAAAGSRSIWSDIIPVGLISGGAALLIWSLWRGQGQGRLARHEPPRRANAQAGATTPDAIVRDAEELAGLLAAQMERQAARLEQLIADADARIRRLEHLNNAPPPPPPRSALSPGTTDPLNRRIYELADEGMPPVEIARALQQQTGKVELILALRKR